MPIHDWTRVIPATFPDFHLAWIFTIRQQLNGGVLPSGYYAMAEQIIGGLGPDVLSLQSRPAGNGTPEGNGSHAAVPEPAGGVLLATSPPRVQFTTSIEPEVQARNRRRIAIRHASDDRVVAVIEIVSPGNKSSQDAIRAFVRKAAELLDAGVHLLVLDLFPPGPRDPQGIHAAIWTEIGGEAFRLPPDSPLTFVSYSADPSVITAYIQPTAVGSVLPEMPLFLAPDRYVPLPLEPSYIAAFDSVPRRWRDELTS